LIWAVGQPGEKDVLADRTPSRAMQGRGYYSTTEKKAEAIVRSKSSGIIARTGETRLWV
jgi:hypothetical protein